MTSASCTSFADMYSTTSLTSAMPKIPGCRFNLKWSRIWCWVSSACPPRIAMGLPFLPSSRLDPGRIALIILYQRPIANPSPIFQLSPSLVICKHSYPRRPSSHRLSSTMVVEHMVVHIRYSMLSNSHSAILSSHLALESPMPPHRLETTMISSRSTTGINHSQHCSQNCQRRNKAKSNQSQ